MANKWIQLMNSGGTDNLFPTTNMDLLWTNASPTSAFAGQTVSIDLSDYKLVYINCSLANTTTDGSTTALIKMNDYGNLFHGFVGTGSGYYVACRRAYVTATGVTFTVGRACTTNTTNNSICIPYQIYGIK